MKFRNMQNQWLIQKMGFDTKEDDLLSVTIQRQDILLQQGNCDPVGAFEDLSLKLIRRL